jgi:hypothetical protein
MEDNLLNKLRKQKEEENQGSGARRWEDENPPPIDAPGTVNGQHFYRHDNGTIYSQESGNTYTPDGKGGYTIKTR